MLISNIGSVYLERVNPTGNIVFNSSANSGPEKTGLLDKYLVLWSSEFGLGHNRSAYCFTIWMASARQ